MMPVPVNSECNSAESSQHLHENFLSHMLMNVLADKPLGSFGEGNLIREAALEKHPNGRMFMHVGAAINATYSPIRMCIRRLAFARTKILRTRGD